MRKKAGLILICLPALLFGCRTAGAPVASAAPQDNSAAIGEDNMDHIEMTDMEIELLCQNYQDVDRIREGKLFGHQEEALRQLRAGTAYLSEKYPSRSLEPILFEAATKFSGRASITFRDEAGEEYALYVTPSGDSYTCADTFYSAFLRDEYNQRMEDTLKAGGYTVAAYTRFSTPVGMELGEGATVDEMLRLYPKLTRDTNLYLASGDHDTAANAIRSLLKQGRFYGAYTLYFVPELLDIEALEAGRLGWEYTVFNCFDI